ncbi:Reverse transcriptase domain [Trinorchestia longiramus]|nr:Reverse transcriptase domain [Trinorchestia longiramus]
MQVLYLNSDGSSDVVIIVMRTFTNFNKANWEAFTIHTEEIFRNAPLPSSCTQGEAFIRHTLQTTANRFVPRGCRKDFIPNLPPSAIPLINQRDLLRTTDPNDPSLPDLNNNITSAISTHSRQTWIDKVQSHSLQQNPSKFWSLLKSLTGKSNIQPPNQPIIFGNRVTTSNPIIAQSFCRQCTLVPQFRRNKSSCKIFRSIHKLYPLDRSFPPFTANQTREAIKKSGTSTAAGPDNVTILHIRHLGPSGISYLTNTFNLSLSHATIPSIWKRAIIITIPKPGKPPSLSSSYRSISLLCPAVKVLERLLLPHLTVAIPLSDSQHGFRPLHSTTSALLPLSHTIAVGFNQHRPPLRTTIMAIDFSKAFDTVPHPQVIFQISSLPLNHHIVRWLVCYLKGRSAKCSYHHHLSSSRPVLADVPQGSVISPALFNLFVSDYPPTAPLITSYADDLTAIATTTKIPDASTILSAHSADVITWAQQKGLTVSIAKSQSSVFTPDTHQSRTYPHVTWEGTDLTHCRSPKILGITFDPHFTFTLHINSICERAQHRLNILKALAGSSWGQQKETITLTYKALINSIVTYAAPIWFPNASPSSIAKLQTIQNTALRIASRSHKMASASHLHRETGVLPVADHLSLLCSQYLLSSLPPHHPNYLTVTQPSGPRNMKHTLQSRLIPSIAHLLSPNGDCLPSTYRQALNTLHSSAVQQAISAAGPNRVLQLSPPPISEEERSLPRSTRALLSQLRSGHSRALNSYQARIGAVQDPTCPACGAAVQTTSHLFSCPNTPTHLTPLDLWLDPLSTATFLSSVPSLSAYFPPPIRPPPERPPHP